MVLGGYKCGVAINVYSTNLRVGGKLAYLKS